MTPTVEAPQRTPGPSAPPPALSAAQQDRRSDLLVLGVCLLLLVGGWLEKTSVQSATTLQAAELPNAQGTVHFALPPQWTVPVADGNTLFTWIDPSAPSAYKTSFAGVARGIDPDSPIDLQTVVDREIADHTANLTGYQLLGEPRAASVDGQPAMQIEYAYAARPIDAQARNALPVVVHAVEYVTIKGARLYLLTQTADAQLYDKEAGTLRAIVDSLRLP